MTRTTLPKSTAFLAATLLLAALVSSPSSGSTGFSDEYVAGGTVVTRAFADQNGTLIDQGGLVCVKRSPVPSGGGGCVTFGQGTSIAVSDDLLGANVAFQVCLDNDGDGFCTFQPGAGGCADDIYFSHDDSGAFHNPLGPLPTGFRSGCPGGPWQGYVVFLCQGVHLDAPDVNTGHTHLAGQGTISPTTATGSGFGNFCGGGVPLGKPYVVI